MQVHNANILKQRAEKNLSNCTRQISHPSWCSSFLILDCFLFHLFFFSFFFCRTSLLNRATHFYVCCCYLVRKSDHIRQMYLAWRICGWQCWCVGVIFEDLGWGFQQGYFIYPIVTRETSQVAKEEKQGGHDVCHLKCSYRLWPKPSTHGMTSSRNREIQR